MYSIVKDNSPFIDWDNIDAIVKRVTVEHTNPPKDNGQSNDGSMGGGNDFM